MGVMMLLPAKPGTCPLCAIEHTPDFPHNAQSLFYRIRFKMLHGRDSTWADAIAHCDDAMKADWRLCLDQINAWTAPPEAIAPIAEPVEGGAS